MKRFAALLAVTALALALFTGCGSVAEPEQETVPPCNPVGVYHTQTIDGKQPMDYFREVYDRDMAGEFDSYEDFLAREGAPEEGLRAPFFLTISEDGSFRMEIPFFYDVTTGTWEAEGNTVTLESTGGSVRVLTARGDTLVLSERWFSQEDVEIVFVR